MSTTGTTSPLRRLVLLGSDEIALPAFRAAAALPGVSIVAVYSQPDRPSGRGQEIQPNAVTAWARAEGYLVRQPERLGPEHAAELGADQVDLGVVMAYGQILKDDLLASTRLGFVNFHGSILPALRGATPVEAALASAWSSTGVSLQQVVRRLDAGPLHAQASCRCRREKVAPPCAPALADWRDNWRNRLCRRCCGGFRAGAAG